jgi:hypothetical protein
MSLLHPSTLLRLYPRAWRDRYGDEFVALLEKEGTGPRVVVNVLAGAFDAWVSPKVVDQYAPADANTLRFWRVQMPPDKRSYAERLPQVLYGVVVFLAVKGIAALGDFPTLDLAAVAIGIALSMVPFWYEGYSWRTKAAASVALGSLGYAYAFLLRWIWP